MNCILWGGTGQARVIRPILEGEGHTVIGIFDNNPLCPPPFDDVPLFGGESAFEEFSSRLRNPCGFVVAIGGTHGEARAELSANLIHAGLTPLSAVHNRAFVAAEAVLGLGCQIHPMAVVAVRARIGDFCIINTHANVDHDCNIGRGAHVSVGAMVAGEVEVGDYAMLGVNATLLPGVTVGSGAVVGAGAVVTRDVEPRTTVVGIPAKPLRRTPGERHANESA